MTAHTDRILKFLKTVEEASTTEIAKRTGLHYQGVKYLLPEMEKKSLITKRTNENETYEYWSLKK